MRPAKAKRPIDSLKKLGVRYPAGSENGLSFKESFNAAAEALDSLPDSDNQEGAVAKMLRANAILRYLPWPKPFDETTHRLRCGDARDLSWIPSGTVDLVVTSPPYFTLKEYEPNKSQLGAIQEYDIFLSE